VTPRFLLDSHALLWSVMDDARLSATARAIIESDMNAVFVSAVSFYELMFKASRGRLPDAIRRLPEAAALGGFRTLEVSQSHFQAAALLEWTHGDPWDRILLAQAQQENLKLISVDTVFDRATDRRVW
jgi:PIN domain nuclease of toxin-antitoxin system